jgi:predicted ferric reductase
MSRTSLDDAIPSHQPMAELTEDAEWLNETMLVNKSLYHANYQTLQEFERSEDRNTRYATVLLATVVGVCVFCGLHKLKKYMLPRRSFWHLSVTRLFEAHINLPALFGKRHLQPLPGNIGYLPSRALSLCIGSYVILNIVICCASYHNVWPNTWYTTKKYEMAAYVGNRTGVLSFANLALAVLFAGRNNILITITGWKQTTFLTFHRWASRVATLQAVVHSIIYTISYFWSPGGSAAVYRAEAAKPYYWWGIIATAALCLAIAFAILPIRLRYYECFLITHIVLVILALMGCWYHIDIRFSKKWGYEVWLYIAFAFWAADYLSRFARLAWYNRKGLANATAEILPGGQFVHITVHPKITWNFGPGQHVFVYFPGLGKFWENHPFSLASWTSGASFPPPQIQGLSKVAVPVKPEIAVVTETSEIEKGFQLPTVESESSSLSTPTPGADARPCIHFLLRINNGMTSSLSRHIIFNTTIPTGVGLPPPQLNLPVAFEGPYGGHLHSRLKYADTILCLAGGIGITNCLSYINQYALEQELSPKYRMMRETSRVVLAWTVKEPELLAHVVDHMIPKHAGGALEVKLWCTGRNEHDEGVTDKSESRMSIGEVLDGVMETGKKIVVIVCGPGGFADEARAQIVLQVKKGMEIDLVEEAFAW